MGSVPVDRRSYRDVEVDIGDRDPDLDLVARPFFADFYLVEIPGIVVVDRRPEEGPEVAGVAGGVGKDSLAKGADFAEDGRRERGDEAVLVHCRPRDGVQVDVGMVLHLVKRFI